MAEDQRKLQELSDAYQKLQTDLQATISARQRLESQQQENEGVQKEFTLLPPDGPSPIYKLLGPVLLRQPRPEAIQAVASRLDFITREIGRLEKQIETAQSAGEGLKMEVFALQGRMQGGLQEGL